MTRRHKSSKRSSRETRDYSDSEESGLKDRRSKENSGSFRVSRESGSIEKRKLDPKDSKDVFNSGNGEYAEEYNSTLKRRKDRTDDGVNDRWNGGEDERTEGSRKSKASSESKSKRRDENEETRSRSEGKHRESSRKETREVERERERKGKEGKSEKFAESEEHNRVSTKSVNEKTELNSHDMLATPDLENQLERRVRRKRDGSGDRDKYEVDIGDTEDKRKDDATNDGKLKDDKHKDERYRDKYRDDVDKEIRHRDDKPTRDHNSNKSDAKYLKDEKSAVENRQKKYKPLDRDRDRDREYENDHDYDLDRDFDASRERDHYRDRDRDRDLGHDRNRDHDGDRDWDRERVRDSERDRDRDRDRRDRDRDRERERDRDRDRDRNRDRDLDHDLDRDFDHGGSQLDDRCVKHKDSRGRKRSPDERDHCNDTKSRGVKVHHPDVENKSLSSSRIEPDIDRGRSQSRQGYVDSTIGSNRRRTSGSPSSHGGADDYRLSKQDEIKYRDSVVGKAPLREVTGFSGASERGSKYRSSERSIKIDDGFPGDLLIERSSSSKASPMGIVERSPSSTSLDRRYMSRSGTRRSLDVEESGRRNSAGPRESSVSREIPMEKPLVDESSQMDLMFYNRTSQSNSSSSLPPPPNFRGGIGSPSFMGSMEDDGRVSVGGRYRRSGDPNMGRGQSNMWRGAPNWSSPLPNGFIPFQHGPPPGGFQAMIPQFPSPSMFNVRPPMDINHSGIPYHIPDADRFSGHMRPLGWQNVMEGTGPSHLHGWDGSNGVFRDEPLMYGGSDWEQNRHIMNGRGWESVWKGENGDVNMDLPSASQKEDQHLLQPPDDDGSTVKGSEKTQYEAKKQNILVKGVEMTSLSSPAKESSKVVSSKTADDKISAAPKVPSVDHVALRCQFYLSKLDISAELAGTEVYSQCLSFLDMEQTSIDENDTDMIINLKEGGIAVPKSSKILLTPFFPAASESVFQRAMDHYTKQRVQMNGFGIGNGETMNIVPTSDPEKADQGYPLEMKAEESALISDEEMLIDPKTTSEHNKDEVVDDAMETVEDQISISLSSKPAENLLDTCPQNLELPDKSPEEPVLTSNEDINMNETMTNSEHVIPEAVDGNVSLPPNASDADAGDASLPTDDVDNEEISKTESDNSVDPVEEKEVMGADGISGNVRKSDDTSPKVADEAMLMPGSNESVILSSRIHHSPESTH